MKKCVLSFLLIFGVVVLTSAQVQRTVLLEHFTQASCGPCASQNPALQSTLNANSSKVVAIKYQVSWPGFDPMYEDNPAQVDSRVSFYGISSVPRSVLDGNVYVGSPSGVTSGSINNRYGVSSPFMLNISHTISPNFDSVYVTMVVKAVSSVSGTLRAHIAVVERHIDWGTAAGSNGETEFFDVMKKMLPSASGTTLPSSWAPGDSVVINESWAMANVYDLKQIAVVGFVQNNANKEVMQAGLSDIITLTPSYALDVTATQILNVAPTNCEGELNPKVVVRNNGGDTITSIDFEYAVNGGQLYTHSWTGNLKFLEEAEIVLPGITFNVDPTNELTVVVKSPNGGVDENQINDTVSISFNEAPTAFSPVTLTIKLDNYPEETRWRLKNSAGQVLYSGGPYNGQNGQTKTEVFILPDNDCYEFTILDSYGDGLLGSAYYRLRDYTNAIIVNGNNFTGSSETTPFGGDTTYAGIDETGLLTQVSVFPNPTSSYTNLSFSLESAKEVNYKIVNGLGQTVLGENLGMMKTGEHQIEVGLKDLESGIYYLQLQAGNKVKSMRISVLR